MQNYGHPVDNYLIMAHQNYSKLNNSSKINTSVYFGKYF